MTVSLSGRTLDLRNQSSLVLDISSLLQVKAPVQERVDGILAARLGLGQSLPQNLALRKALHTTPGSPWGGLGFFEWTADLEQAIPDLEQATPDSDVSMKDENGCNPSPDAVPPSLVMQLKLQEFKRCADGVPSFYVWAMHPIFDNSDRAVGAEVLVRAKNGADSAPIDDIKALMDPDAPHHVKQVYAQWKIAEIVDFSMRALRDFPVLRRLRFISVNVRPGDLATNSPIFRGVVRRLWKLAPEDRRLLLSMVIIEVLEDQEHPRHMETFLDAWQELGFRCGYDDTVSGLTRQALGMDSSENYHTTCSLEPMLKYFWLVKVDMDWAAHMIFLCHPRLGKGDGRKAEVLCRARSEGLVYVAHGASALRNTGVKHADVLAEFAEWAQHMILRGKKVCIECSVRQDDPNCALAVEGLRELNLDIFGTHSAHFCFQGGPFGPKAFQPSQLAEHCM